MAEDKDAENTTPVGKESRKPPAETFDWFSLEEEEGSPTPTACSRRTEARSPRALRHARKLESRGIKAILRYGGGISSPRTQHLGIDCYINTPSGRWRRLERAEGLGAARVD
ncbi:hypothetical protein SKAU_G00281480 [Synaphobranchus kaupii]|uniref:Uncharacterized protein n=1 Tax=Synaphobranchus kaupii TaxID=118154 RepID=A0A9Q1ILW2_SYNKA|nr:hypothetical protein SKAU_G00281480 [Synaphobranchus kaupii]